MANFFFFSKSLQYVSVILKNDMYYKTECLTVILLNVCLLLVHVPQKYIGKKCSFFKVIEENDKPTLVT